MSVFRQERLLVIWLLNTVCWRVFHLYCSVCGWLLVLKGVQLCLWMRECVKLTVIINVSRFPSSSALRTLTPRYEVMVNVEIELLIGSVLYLESCFLPSSLLCYHIIKVWFTICLIYLSSILSLWSLYPYVFDSFQFLY